MIVNLRLDPDKDPNELDAFVESERSRVARKNQLQREVEYQIRANELAAKRADRLDKYFSKNPPNGALLTIYYKTLEDFANSNGEPPRWMDYPHLTASFDRLQSRGVLKVEFTADAGGKRIYKSEVTAQANRRNVRPAELDTAVARLKQSLGEVLQSPPTNRATENVHGCRYVPTIDKWRVSLYFGGAQRALGCYPFDTAVRLQDVLAYYFSSYRRAANYNTSEAQAEELLATHLALATFCAELEKLWLAAGILVKPGVTVDKAAEWKHSVETRLTAIEARLKITP